MTTTCDRCPTVAEWLAYSAYQTDGYNEDGEPGVVNGAPSQPHPLVGHYPAAIIRACSIHLVAELSDCLQDDLLGLPAEEDPGSRWVVVPTVGMLTVTPRR